MKFVIKEDQLNPDLVKKMFFKYWTKYGPKLDDGVFSLIGAKSNNSRYFNAARGWLIEFLGGEDVAQDLAEEILDSIPNRVTDCGSYNFEFYVEMVESTGSEFWTIYCYVDPEGKFTHIETGREYTLKELSDENPDWAWEVNEEMAECISELIEDKEFVARTGIDFQVIISGLKKESED